MKTWVIKCSSPFCGTNEYFKAYSENDPTLNEDFRDIENEIVNDLWDNYNWMLHLEDEEFEYEEEEEAAWEEAWSDWVENCSIVAEETDDFSLYSIEGSIEGDDLDVIYDERNKNKDS